MLIKYEREKITESIGSKEAKINFLQKYGRTAIFEKNYSQFFAAGIYQLEEGPPIVVLPWFLKKNDKILLDKKLLNSDLSFFEVIRDIKSFTDVAIDLSKESGNTNALDIIVHSYLINLKKTVTDLLCYNYHEEVSEKTNVIKGRWDIPKDLNQGMMPTKFTCTYNSLEINIPFFLFVKTFCRYLSTMLKSRKNLGLIDEILALLRDVQNENLNRKLIQEAYHWTRLQKGREILSHVVEFAEGLILDQTIYSKEAGLSYHFQMDKFFEQLIFNFLKMSDDLVVLPQSREDLLGGANWKSTEDRFNYETETKKARQYTIPDIVAFDSQRYLIFECKYKPLRVPFINSDDESQDLSSFSREDRNQLLSFIMSIRPSPELRNKKIDFILIFPCSFIEKIKISELLFESAKLHIDPIVRNLIQNRMKVEDGNGLSIKFLGVNVAYMMDRILSKDSSAVKSTISLAVGGEQIKPASLGESKFERLVQKRVALTGLIVDKAKNDPTMGRVKLAKVFYLADAHLKLGMEAQYIREAAGPLDQRLLYNEKWGIETQGHRHSFYRRIENKKGNRYIPGTNIGTVVDRARSIFVDKIENIDWLIDLLQPLDTERAEIVTTLYACWNDLLSRKAIVSDEEIIQEFLSNWHQSKKRFDSDRLLKALIWMKEKGLIPDGSGPGSAPKQEKIPSGF